MWLAVGPPSPLGVQQPLEALQPDPPPVRIPLGLVDMAVPSLCEGPRLSLRPHAFAVQRADKLKKLKYRAG